MLKRLLFIIIITCDTCVGMLFPPIAPENYSDKSYLSEIVDRFAIPKNELLKALEELNNESFGCDGRNVFFGMTDCILTRINKMEENQKILIVFRNTKAYNTIPRGFFDTADDETLVALYTRGQGCGFCFYHAMGAVPDTTKQDKQLVSADEVVSTLLQEFKSPHLLIFVLSTEEFYKNYEGEYFNFALNNILTKEEYDDHNLKSTIPYLVSNKTEKIGSLSSNCNWEEVIAEAVDEDTSELRYFYINKIDRNQCLSSWRKDQIYSIKWGEALFENGKKTGVEEQEKQSKKNDESQRLKPKFKNFKHATIGKDDDERGFLLVPQNPSEDGKNRAFFMFRYGHVNRLITNTEYNLLSEIAKKNDVKLITVDVKNN